MTFTAKQARALRAKLARQHVKTRSNNGATIAYVEGWHVIAEANRIFGYDCWDRCTLQPKCLWTDRQHGQIVCFYSTRVRVTVRAGDSVITREGIGTGSGRSQTAETAHEIALKAAETDATKRALATFGNPFGLALYDKEQTGVTKPIGGTNKAGSTGILTATVDKFELFDAALGAGRMLEVEFFKDEALRIIAKLGSKDEVHDFWEKNRASLTAIRQANQSSESDPIDAIFAALRERANTVGGTSKLARQDKSAKEPLRPAAAAALVRAPEAARLPITKERRVRDKEHLAFVASQPCLICGRRPAHAHHLKFAQPKAMAMKVSDEYSVPLCAIHHDALHRSGDERAWWARSGIIEPLKIAERLWQTPRHERQRWLTSGDQSSEENSPDPRSEVDQRNHSSQSMQITSGSGAESGTVARSATEPGE